MLIESVDRPVVMRERGTRVIAFVCAPESPEIVTHAPHIFE
jgi:hypothetical protein